MKEMIKQLFKVLMTNTLSQQSTSFEAESPTLKVNDKILDAKPDATKLFSILDGRFIMTEK